jgi:hypothetical protein
LGTVQVGSVIVPSDDLIESWSRTRRHLDRAWVQLPPGADPAAYREFLDHNELELAMEALADVGNVQEAPTLFWEALADAADQMQLNASATEYRLRGSTLR